MKKSKNKKERRIYVYSTEDNIFFKLPRGVRASFFNVLIKKIDSEIKKRNLEKELKEEVINIITEVEDGEEKEKEFERIWERLLKLIYCGNKKALKENKEDKKENKVKVEVDLDNIW